MSDFTPLRFNLLGAGMGIALGAGLCASNGAATGISIGAAAALLFGLTWAPKKYFFR